MPALRPRTIWLLLAAVVALVWVVVGIPAWHIQPFRPQSGDGMAWSYALRSRGPLLTAIGVVAAAALVAPGLAGDLARARPHRLRRPARPWRWLRRGSCARTTSSGCSRRWRRHSGAAGAADAGFLADAEMVMGVQVRRRRGGVPGPPARLSPRGEHGGRRRARRRHLLNAVSHRSGVSRGGAGTDPPVPAGRDQQPELRHAGRGDRQLVAAGHR